MTFHSVSINVPPPCRRLRSLRPHGLAAVGLREALHDLVNGWQARVADRFHCSLHIRGNIDVLPPDLNITVYRLIQECLTNAVRHSRARMITLRLSIEEPSAASPAASRLLLDVTESEMAANGTAVGASGAPLLGMRQRAHAHAGH